MLCTGMQLHHGGLSIHGTADGATNVRVKVSGIEIYTLSKSTGTWTKVSSGNGAPTWAYIIDYNLSTFVSAITPRVEPDRHLSYKLDSSLHPIHGGVGHYPITGIDVAAVFAKLITELILDDLNGVDDRASAQILATIGANYYPSITTLEVEFAPFDPPAAGSGRYSLVTAAPRLHYFATINPPGGAGKTVFEQGGGVVSIPVTQFAANPPPLP